MDQLDQSKRTSLADTHLVEVEVAVEGQKWGGFSGAGLQADNASVSNVGRQTKQNGYRRSPKYSGTSVALRHFKKHASCFESDFMA